MNRASVVLIVHVNRDGTTSVSVAKLRGAHTSDVAVLAGAVKACVAEAIRSWTPLRS